jgi:hypothetical protein
MPPHNAIVTIRPRSLANVRADLREAREDVLQAESDGDGDRLGEAQCRHEDLQDEYGALLLEATGLTIEQIREDFAEARI